MYDVSPSRGSEIVLMLPATKETTTPMPNLGEREARQKPSKWKPPSGPSSLKMVITSGSGFKRDLTVSDRGHITWFTRDKNGNLIMEERKADERTMMSLEIDDKAKTIHLCKTRLSPDKKTIDSLREKLYS